MPGWKLHFAVAEKVAAHSNYAKNSEMFKLGSVIADTPWVDYSAILDPNCQKNQIHYYESVPLKPFPVPNYQKYFTDFFDKIKESYLYRGFFIHLIEDHIFNDKFNSRTRQYGSIYTIEDYGYKLIEKTTLEEVTKLKNQDAAGFSSELMVGPLKLENLPADIEETIQKEFGPIERLNMKRLVGKINEIATPISYRRNIIFNSIQYKQMLNSTISIYLKMMYDAGLESKEPIPDYAYFK